MSRISRMGLILAAALAGGARAADLVSLERGGSAVASYETFAAAMSAAQAGDTIRFLSDWTGLTKQQTVTKAVTVDLGGHAVTNDTTVNSFKIQASPVVFRNGELGGAGGSAFDFQANTHVYATNLVLRTCGGWGSAGGTLHAGQGCVFKASLVSGNGGTTTIVEDASVIAVGSELVNGASANSWHLYLLAGLYRQNPAGFVAAPGIAVAQSTSTAYGTCNYTIRPREDGEIPVAEIGTGSLTNVFESFGAALTAVRTGETINLRKDVAATEQFTFSRAFTLNLNGHGLSRTGDGNLLSVTASGCVITNGTVATANQSVVVPSQNVTVTFAGCLLTHSTPDSCTCIWSTGAGSKVILRDCTVTTGLTLLSRAGGCCATADVYGGDIHTTALWSGGSSASVLTVHTGRFAADPNAYRAADTFQREISESTSYGTLAYEVRPESEKSQYDLSGYAARVGSAYFSTWAHAYDAVPANGTLVVNRDLTDFAGSIVFNKSMTLDLDGHLITQATGGNFVCTGTGVTLAITGGGTIRVVGSSVVCLGPGSGSTIDVYDCTCEGNCLVYSGSGGRVNLLSAGSVCDTTRFVSGNGSATVGVSNGVIRSSTAWDTGAGSSGTMVNVAGGVWRIDPLTLTSKAKFALADGCVTRQDAADGFYNVVPLGETLAADLSSAAVPVYRGTAPASGATVTVAFTASDGWAGERKLVADYSALENAGALSLAVASYPSAYGTSFRAYLKDGRLYARLVRGTALIFR